jgi:hypothetical protein
MEPLMDQFDPKQLELAAQAAPYLEEGTRNFLQKVTGGLLDELNLLLAEKLRFRRYENLVRMIKRAEKISSEEGIAPKTVPLKLLFPILENASLEEDDSMSDRWAALLANAADSASDTSVLPSFVGILKELSPREAMILDTIHSAEDRLTRVITALDVKSLLNIREEMLRVMIDNLIRLGLLEGVVLGRFSVDQKANQPIRRLDKIGLGMTELGMAFVSACHRPKPSPLRDSEST